MPKHYFRFKQFIIYQDKAAMKVGADSVILGSWIKYDTAKNILDIGTGTGLLSLMAAQKSNAKITAIEIDSQSSEQAKINFNLSPWNKRITLIHNSFQNFSKKNNQKFDLIICNPPYFNNSYQSANKQRNAARQNNLLSLSDLFSGIHLLLSKDGFFYIIYPFLQKNILFDEAKKHQLYPNKILEIKTQENKKAKRIIVCFTQKKSSAITHQLNIRDANTSKYSNEYIKLTKEFYLNF